MSHPKQSQEVGQALVTTDDRSLSRLISRLLQPDGYEVVECRDHENLEICMADPSPAVIVLDEAVTPGDPLDLCRAIRKLPGCDYIPLLLLSDSRDNATAERAYEQNVTTVVTKPIDEDAFRKNIRSLGDTGRTLSGIRALRTPESDVLRTMPDAFFVAGSDGLLRQYLAGLTTRASFANQSDSIIADAKLRERGVAVFCIDIYRFGRINDTLGRAVGDAVLKVTAQHIERCMRSSDKLARIEDDDKSTLTRISGDELYRAIKSDPGTLVEEGAINAIESVDDVGKGYA